MARPAAEGILVYRQVPGMRGSWPRRTGADLLRDGPFLQATQGDGGEQVGRPRRESSGGRGGGYIVGAGRTWPPEGGQGGVEPGAEVVRIDGSRWGMQSPCQGEPSCSRKPPRRPVRPAIRAVRS